LIEITRQITSSLDLDEIVRRSLRQVHDSWQVETSSLWLIDEERQVLDLQDMIGEAVEETEKTSVPIGRGILGYVAQSGQPIATGNAARHPFYDAEIDNSGGVPTRALLCVPLLYRNQVIGLLRLANKVSGTFDEADVERAQGVGSAVAIALSNALDYEWMTGQYEELENRLRSIRTTALALKRVAQLDGETEALLTNIIAASTQVSDLATGMLTLPNLDKPTE
jgi:signal transduction protein with GAF and PtsI domain